MATPFGQVRGSALVASLSLSLYYHFLTSFISRFLFLFGYSFSFFPTFFAFIYFVFGSFFFLRVRGDVGKVFPEDRIMWVCVIIEHD